MKKPELLAPAGDLERLKWAILYGADAVYLGGALFGLRANANNFTLEEIKEGVTFAHERGKRIYVTVNIVLHNKEIPDLIHYLQQLEEIGVDAIIVSDPTVISLAHKHTNLEIHLSTQQSTLNRKAVLFWKQQGVTRIVLGREASKEEIKNIIDHVDIEIECFIHGAMCASYSGRCVLSNFLTARDSNRGGCSQICRWDFKLLDEQKKNIEGEKDFTLCAKDLSLLAYIKDMMDIGITSFKIEGRMKSAQYVGAVTKAYADSIHYYLEHKKLLDTKEISQTLKLLFNRSFTKGYLLNEQNDKLTSTYRPNHIGQKVGKVIATYPHKIKIQLIEPLSQKDKVVILQKERRKCTSEIYA